MFTLRSELKVIVARLLASSQASGTVTLDAIGEALGAMAVSMDEIEAVMTALEESGREIVGASGPGAEALLRMVVEAARELRSSLNRRPTADEVARHAGLSVEQTRIALSLLRVMQR